MTEQNYTAPDLTLVGDDHIAAYRETDGEVGYLWNGVPTLLLDATGRHSGDRSHLRADLRPRRRRLPRRRVDGRSSQAPGLVPQPAGQPGGRDPGEGASAYR